MLAILSLASSPPAPWAAALRKSQPKEACACAPSMKAGGGHGGKRSYRQDAGGAGAKGPTCGRTAQAALDRISLADDLAELAQANVIIEAIVERLDLKQALFAKLDSMTGPDTILASNTSSIPITAIAAACRSPERVCGMHFFNPVPLMRLVEVIPGLKTAAWVGDAFGKPGAAHGA
jgi:3-hydroxybutyryl-CoA dehydrogenase